MNAYLYSLQNATNQDEYAAANNAIVADIAADPEGTLRKLALAYQAAKIAELGADANYKLVGLQTNTMYEKSVAYDAYVAWSQACSWVRDLGTHLGNCAVQLKEERK